MASTGGGSGQTTLFPRSGLDFTPLDKGGGRGKKGGGEGRGGEGRGGEREKEGRKHVKGEGERKGGVKNYYAQST